jgi:hypothetical protein
VRIARITLATAAEKSRLACNAMYKERAVHQTIRTAEEWFLRLLANAFGRHGSNSVALSAAKPAFAPVSPA